MLKHLLITATLASAVFACATDDPMMDPSSSTTTFKVRVENIAPWTVLKSGLQDRKTDNTTGAAGPGKAFEITFTAGAKQKISFATMLGQSNDWFFGPGPTGIALYDATGAPRSGDVTSEVSLWDAGTEIDQEPSVGDATGPRQGAHADLGAPDPDPTVRSVGAVAQLSNGTTFALPSIRSMIRVTLTPGADRQFTLLVENVSTATTLTTSLGPSGVGLSPVVWALHLADGPLFTIGSADRALGLEQVAESGRGAELAASLHALSGWPTPLSPGVFVVHQDSEPLYGLGVADTGRGLEELAESGSVMLLADSVARSAGSSAHGVFNTPLGATAPGAARPGDVYEFEVTGSAGDRVSFATMFGMSNDWFFATRPDGIALFDAAGRPVSGDVSGAIALYDAGTEIDQEPAIGADTGPQQAAPNSGRIDPVRIVREVPPTVNGALATAHVRVTLEPQ